VELAGLSTYSELQHFIQSHPDLLVLTGAGCSLASGIPTYRDRQGNWQRNNPIQHKEFVELHSRRQRYWARSYAGWPAVAAAKPNTTHMVMADWERKGLIRMLVTQNVDRLHQRAGQEKVIDLHGRLDQVICLDCDRISSRFEVQQRLAQLNPQLTTTGILAPDGDADVADSLVAQVVVPDCDRCGGLLKPNVVFFGDSVKRDTVNCIYQTLEQSAALLVVGSSLMVFSGFRFCRRAHELGKPMACINPGKTRADELFQLKIAADCSEVLDSLPG